MIMPTDIRQLPHHIDSTATMRIWGQGIHDQIANCGLVQTADTGQIDWAAVVKPNGGFAGYEIWRFNDALQATAPAFFKIKYGVSPSVFDRPALSFQAARGSDGAGTLVGGVTTEYTQYPGPVGQSKPLGAMHPSYCSGTPSRLSLATGVDTHFVPASPSRHFAAFFGLERSKNFDGTETGDLLIIRIGTYWGDAYGVIPATGNANVQQQQMALSPFQSSVPSIGNEITLSPTLACWGKIFYASYVVYPYDHIGPFITFQAYYLGAMRTFMPFPGWVPGPQLQSQSFGGSTAIFWE